MDPTSNPTEVSLRSDSSTSSRIKKVTSGSHSVTGGGKGWMPSGEKIRKTVTKVFTVTAAVFLIIGFVAVSHGTVLGLGALPWIAGGGGGSVLVALIVSSIFPPPDRDSLFA